ncbi:MAG: glycosyltransferase family 2 protein [Acidobacteria bacterium]|nr:glycosyltransferase family 2 protein [Acidobacteriota bacterium]
MTAPPRLSIVIVTFNSVPDIDRCLASLAAAPPATSHQIVVVDNASPDGTAAHVRQRWPRVTVLDAGGNTGFSHANNVGIRATRGELILLLNPDTVVPAGALDALIATLERHPGAAVAGPRLVDGLGRAELSHGPMISPFAELGQKLLVRAHARGSGLAARVVERRTRRPATVDWVSGACLLVRREAAERVGLLDERFFMYTEDVDFCARLRAAGYQVRFDPSSEVVHLRGRSAASAPSATAAAYRRSHLQFYARHHPRWVPVLRAYLKVRGQLPDSDEQ